MTSLTDEHAAWPEGRARTDPARGRARQAVPGPRVPPPAGRVRRGWRYAAIALLAGAAIWGPIAGYLSVAPQRFRSEAALILPGAGAQASVNLNDMGQASSQAASPFSSSSISPTETYKRLIGADRVLADAAARLQVTPAAFGRPRVELVDQTGLIRITVTGGSPAAARARGEALIGAFFDGLDTLRRDELAQREQSGSAALQAYRDSVTDTRREIEALQRQSGLIAPEQYKVLVADTDDLARQLAARGAAVQERRQAVAHLQAALGLSPAGAAATLKLHADTEFAALTEAMAAQAADLADLEARFGVRHPQVSDRRAALAALRARAAARAAAVTGLDSVAAAALDAGPIGARAALLGSLVEMDTDLRALEAETAALAARHDRQSAKVADMIAPAARLEDLQRNFRVAETVLASAVARSQSSKTDLYASYPLVQVLQAPNLPDGPSSPRTGLALAAGGAATMMVLTGLALAWIRRALILRLLAAGQGARGAVEPVFARRSRAGAGAGAVYGGGQIA